MVILRMAQPATTPTWATDATFTSGPKSGANTKVTPSAGALAQGDVPGQPYRSERKNWLFYWTCQWIAYLKNLATDAFFLGQTYAWTAQHTNTNEHSFDAPKTYTKTIAIAKGLIPGSLSNLYYIPSLLGVGKWHWQAGSGAGDILTFDPDLPTGAVVTGLEAGMNSSTGLHSMYVYMNGWPVLSGGGTGTIVNMRNGTGAAVTGDQKVTTAVTGSASQVIDRSANDYNVTVNSQDGGTPGASELKYITITYTMPGYRNG